MQCDFIVTISKDEYIVELINALAHDFAAADNHAFDYGMENLGRPIQESALFQQTKLKSYLLEIPIARHSINYYFIYAR